MQDIHVQLPDDIYRRLLQMATALHRPLEDVLIQTIRGNLPPALDGLPREERDLVAALAPLDDDALRAIAAGSLPASRWRRHRHLLRKAEEGTLTTFEADELAILRTEVDRSVIRRSCALALLRWRGFTLPIAS